MANYELSDDSVVVIIGSGAGGGTLANELCQKGIKVVLLEAGPRHTIRDFVNNEWAAFSMLAWTDKRTASGNWRVVKDFPNLPTWACKTVGGTTVHWAGASLRFQEHEFQARTTCSVFAIFDQPVHMYRGTTMAGIVMDEASNDPSRGFVGGYHMETISFGVPFLAAFLNPGAWGRDYTSLLEGYSNMAGMWLVGEDMPSATNRITLNPSEKDQWGLPIPDVHYDDHENDIAMRNHAFKQGDAVYQAVEATQTIEVPPYPSTHNLGTCRMSANSRDGACNKFGQTHDIANLFISDGSQFTSGGAENPTLTIVTLAIRQSDYVADQMGKNQI